MSQENTVSLTYAKPFAEIPKLYGDPPSLYETPGVYYEDVLQRYVYTIIDDGTDIKDEPNHIFTITNTDKYDIRTIDADEFKHRGFAYVNLLDSHYITIQK